MALASPPQSRLPRVFVVGAPASGKSTARSFIADWFKNQGAHVAVLGIEEAHRELLPADKEDGTYFYDEFGALILFDRDKQIPAALELLTRQCREAASRTGFVVELAHEKLVGALLTLGDGLLSGSLVLHLSAPLSVRLEWNARRTVSRVPESIVIGYAEKLRPEEIKLIESKGAQLESIDSADDGERCRSHVLGSISRFFASNPTEPTFI